MPSAIPRYGARVLPDTRRILCDVAALHADVQGPHLAAFEHAFAHRVGAPAARATSYGRTAFFHLLHALHLPAGSEIVFPALTFWVVPEMARAAGLVPVFADVDPRTFTLDPDSLRRVVSAKTRAVVPTHLWGLPCDMDAILDVAREHGLVVVEDCAHALGATYRGRPVGTIGDAGFYSFQLLKPLNTYGGGMAVARAPDVMARLGERLAALPPPTVDSVRRRFRLGRLQQTGMSRGPFTAVVWPLLWLSSWTDFKPDTYLWEAIRPLSPQPPDYPVRYSNAQAALGLAALERLDAWTLASQRNAARLDALLAGEPAIGIPARPKDRTHVYYQYCVYVSNRDRVARRALRRGVDLETLHVDVCTDLPLFADCRRDGCSGARHAAQAVQLPVYSTLSPADVNRVGRVVISVARDRVGPVVNSPRPMPNLP